MGAGPRRGELRQSGISNLNLPTTAGRFPRSAPAPGGAGRARIKIKVYTGHSCMKVKADCLVFSIHKNLIYFLVITNLAVV